MIGREQLERLWTSLLGLGGRRLAVLALVGASVFATVALSGYYLSRPDLEMLYAGLNAQDVSRIGATLKDAGIVFDVNSQGNAVLVRRGQTAQARMLLAEKGLPSSSNAGYELFDKLGSIGLTSFMQEVTRVRALEGEIARTIQAMRGVKAARVHIVLPDSGSFRRNRQPPSASVIIRTEFVQRLLLGAGHPPSRGRRGIGHDHRSGHRAEHRRDHPGRGRRLRQRLSEQDDQPREDGRPRAAGQHRQDAHALSRLQQLRDQRGRAPQHRQAADQRDQLQSRSRGSSARCASSRRPATSRTSIRAMRSASSRTSRPSRRAPPPATSRSAPTSAARS